MVSGCLFGLLVIGRTAVGPPTVAAVYEVGTVADPT